MAVIAEFQYDGAHVRIHDDCCVKTEEENARILKRVTAIANEIYAEEKRRG